MEAPPKHPEFAALFGRLLDELGITGAQLAKELKTSQQAISNYTSGRNKPGRELMAGIIERYPAINAGWLLTGKGDPFPNGVFNQLPTAAHPTILPADKELTVASEPAAPRMTVNREGQLDGYWKMVAEERAARLSDKDQEIERLMAQLEAWQEAFRKPLASAEAAAHLSAYVNPIGFRTAASGQRHQVSMCVAA